MKSLKVPTISTLILLFGSLVSGWANASPMTLPVGGLDFSMDVVSFSERRFNNVIRQERDFSCGAAALATMLKYNYGHESMVEQTVLNAMLEEGDKDKIRREGFSMLDMKNYLEKIGLQANGYRASLDKLKEAGIPAITLINSNGYMHFVVVGGLTDEVVIVRDPALGNRVIPRKDFLEIWNGVLFVILDNTPEANKSFKQAYDWQERRDSLAGEIFSSYSISDFTLKSISTPGYTNF